MDGASACPFVAFEDDREARATSPDHRHRCFAEATPGPRALAHQEAYCLSSAFPVCPTFQDWARREAAHARGADDRPAVEASASAAVASASAADDRPAAEATASAAFVATQQGPPDANDSARPGPPGSPVEDAEAHRNPPRDWAAPPPWATRAMGAGAAGKSGRGTDEASTPEFLARRATEGAGLAGSAADRMAGGPLPTSGGLGQSMGVGARSSPGSGLPSGVGSGPPGSVVGSIPPAVVGGAAGIVVRGVTGAGIDASSAADDELAGLVQGRGFATTPREPAHHIAPPGSKPGRRQTVSSTRPSGDPVTGPSWERMKRYEAYPTIKTRVGLPDLPVLPRVVVLAAALGVAALALFFLPALLGVGGGGGTTATASPSASRPAATASSSPTTQPAPTAQVYVIAAGDTLSRVAKKFGLTVEELLAANKDTITNPDKISIGDEIIIPAPPQDEFTDPSAEPSAQSPTP